MPSDAPLRLRAAIEQGTFAPGSKLPPSREHAQALGVARCSSRLQRTTLRQAARHIAPLIR